MFLCISCSTLPTLTQQNFIESDFKSKGSTSSAETTHESAKKVLSEEEEFSELMKTNNLDLQKKKEEQVNVLFENNHVNKKTSLIMVENQSKCNIIVRITGQKNYDLPVPSLSKNSVIVEKGDYVFKSNICDAQYQSFKTIKDNLQVILKNTKIR